MRRSQFSIRVVRDRSDGSWTVVRHHRTGWKVIWRGDSQDEAMTEAQREVEAMRWDAATA